MCTHHVSSFLQKLEAKRSVLLHSCALFKHKHLKESSDTYTPFYIYFPNLVSGVSIYTKRACMCFLQCKCLKRYGSRDFHVARGLPSGWEWRSRTWPWDPPSAGRSWRTTWPLSECLSPPHYCPKEASWPKISTRNTSPHRFHSSWESQTK